MRGFPLAITVAFLHRLLAYGLWWLGFVVGMGSFTSASAGTAGRFIWALSGLLDFPVLAVASISAQLRYGKMPSGEMALAQAPLFEKLVWSMVVGIIAAVGVHFYRQRAGAKAPRDEDPYMT
jgi:hypothetical protein